MPKNKIFPLDQPKQIFSQFLLGKSHDDITCVWIILTPNFDLETTKSVGGHLLVNGYQAYRVHKTSSKHLVYDWFSKAKILHVRNSPNFFKT